MQTPFLLWVLLSTVVTLLPGCDGKPAGGPVVERVVLKAGDYETRDGVGRLKVGADGELELTVNGRRTIASCKMLDGMAVVSVKGEDSPRFVMGEPVPKHDHGHLLNVFLPAAQIQTARQHELWARERAEKIRTAEGSRQRAVAEMKSALQSVQAAGN